MPGDDSPVPDLVERAAAGDAGAWDELVERYAPLVLSVVRRHRLQAADGEDVVQTLWLRLVEHLPDLRDPRALPGWIVSTASHECLRVLRLNRRVRPFDPLDQVDAPGPADPRREDGSAPVEAEVILEMAAASRHEALLSAFADLPESQRRLLLLLVTDPPLTYAEISARLGVPIGSIGPSRARALERIRRHPAVAARIEQPAPQTPPRTGRPV